MKKTYTTPAVEQFEIETIIPLASSPFDPGYAGGGYGEADAPIRPVFEIEEIPDFNNLPGVLFLIFQPIAATSNVISGLMMLKKQYGR